MSFRILKKVLHFLGIWGRFHHLSHSSSSLCCTCNQDWWQPFYRLFFSLWSRRQIIIQYACLAWELMRFTISWLAWICADVWSKLTKACSHSGHFLTCDGNEAGARDLLRIKVVTGGIQVIERTAPPVICLLWKSSTYCSTGKVNIWRHSKNNCAYLLTIFAYYCIFADCIRCYSHENCCSWLMGIQWWGEWC